MASKIILLPTNQTYEAPQGSVIEKIYAFSSTTNQSVTCSGPIVLDKDGAAANAPFLLVQNIPLFVEGPFTKVVNSASAYSIIYIK